MGMRGGAEGVRVDGSEDGVWVALGCLKIKSQCEQEQEIKKARHGATAIKLALFSTQLITIFSRVSA